MFERLTCSLLGHTEEVTTEYQWDIPLHPNAVPDDCMKDGFVSCKWERCNRCNRLLESPPVPTEEHPSPVETAPLL